VVTMEFIKVYLYIRVHFIHHVMINIYAQLFINKLLN
jgi:hypothetical protein